MIQIEMEMADKCSECRFQTEYEFCSAMPKNFCGSTSDEGKPDWCPLKNADGWISVKDRLPGKNGDYLTYTCDGIVWPYFFTSSSGVWEDALGYSTDTVTHWMPLPEPPKTEK